jgi:NAD(P)-dependent dehydrogenase (short-subunit alcohol dehydrogenase family)
MSKAGLNMAPGRQNMKGRVVVITGATGATGQAAARAFAEQGASLALISRDQGKLDALNSDLNLPEDRILTRTIELLDVPSVQEAARAVSARFGRVDALIHLVGGWTGGRTISESGVDEFKFMLDQHAWTTIHLLRAFSPGLSKNGWGRVIAVTSPLAENPTGKMGPYALGKAAQETLILTLADEFKNTDLTANVIQVEAIDVKGTGDGTLPEEIVAAMLYLCSDEAGRVNGTRLPLY